MGACAKDFHALDVVVSELSEQALEEVSVCVAADLNGLAVGFGIPPLNCACGPLAPIGLLQLLDDCEALCVCATCRVPRQPVNSFIEQFLEGVFRSPRVIAAELRYGISKLASVTFVLEVL